MEASPKIGDCIFCGQPVLKNSLEHIVPESLGNENYTLPKGSICGRCNNAFSDFEDKSLTKTMLGFERARSGVITKKGRPATAKSHNIRIQGDKNFRRNIINIAGITADDIEEIKEDGTFKVRVLDFDKSDMATSKLMLKIGFEALYKSRRAIFKKWDLTDLREHLTKKNNDSWPILTATNSFVVPGYQSIPRYFDKFLLNKIRCRILYFCGDENTLLVNFRYSVLSYVVNLKSRDISWVNTYYSADDMAHLYPEHLRKRLIKANNNIQ